MMTLRDVAETIGAKLPPDADSAMQLSGASTADDAQPGEVTFYDNPRYLRSLLATKAAVVLAPLTFDEPLPLVILRVANPIEAFEKIFEGFTPAPPFHSGNGIHPTASVHERAEIHPTADIHACAVIEAGVKIGPRTVVGAQAFIGRDSQLGEGCHLHPHAVLRESTVLGARVIIHSNAVVGSDGFGFRFEKGAHRRLPHRGYVQLDDDVEVGSCTTIDRGRFGRTWIQTGTKIDNLVQIAHNVVIGPHCLIIAQTGISGSASLGKYVTLAGQVGVVGHVQIGDQVVVAAKSGVSKDAPAGHQLMGTYGIPVKEARELVAHYHRLPKTAAKIKKLEREVEELKAMVSALLPKGSSFEVESTHVNGE
jgi:UDP-3-O-[3-hydroxymyristoyl] glucosamine N-acyltransferase